MAPGMQVEAVFFTLYDIGRNINLKLLPDLVHNLHQDQIPLTAHDTPMQISLPKPYIVDFPPIIPQQPHTFKEIRVKVKFYEDGVISFVARIQADDIELTSLHTIRHITFPSDEGPLAINQYIKLKFAQIFQTISPTITPDLYPFEKPEMEEYVAFCLFGPADIIKNPSQFIEENKNYLAPLLQAENNYSDLHPAQIESTLAYPFYFSRNDCTIFDWDRCLIIDSDREYDDILLIAELANYMLLELRALDRVLDKSLDVAEDDIKAARYKGLGGKINILTEVRYDALFTLENLENVSKIIGDYYLAVMYSHLCNVFKLDEWSKSIRNRLFTLNEIYTMAKQDKNERVIVLSEVLVVVLILFELIIPILELLTKK